MVQAAASGEDIIMPKSGEILAEAVEEFIAGASWGTGLAVVALAALVGAPHAKPLAKEAIKGCLRLNHEAQRWAAGAIEQVEALYAEAKDEYEAGRIGSALAAGTAAGDASTETVAAAGESVPPTSAADTAPAAR
jgi:hypothetical protein